MRVSRARLWIAACVITAAAAGGALWLGTAPGHTVRTKGAALAAALRAGIEATGSARAPHRCARLDEPGEASAAPERPWTDAPGGRRLLRWGSELRVEPADRSLTLGLVADARGELESLPQVRHAFAEAGVELVVSLGGMGRDRETIARALEALAGEARDREDWLLLAIPGDWESIPAHRSATTALAERGVIDGSRVRFVDMDGVWLATLPGAPHRSRLVVGDDGCVYTPEDAAGVVAALAARPGVRALLAHAPPRQEPTGPTPADDSGVARPTDVGRTGISMGEQALAHALRATPVDVVMHALVAPAPDQRRGAHPISRTAPVILAAGGLDPLARLIRDPANTAGRALLEPATQIAAVTAVVTAERVTWRPVRLVLPR